MKHYVVAGGAGFLGSHLTDRLLRAGNQVTVMDSCLTGRKDNLPKHDRLRVVEHDIRQPQAVDDHVDYVCNLASPASPKDYFQHPILTLETGAHGIKNMLDLALHHQARFFHTSTSEVYGDPLVHPQPESYFGNVDPYAMRSGYDGGKRYAEALIYQYRHDKGLNTGVIRIFNTYGPRMQPDDGRVVSIFIRQALSGEPLTIQGTSTQTRSFCDVDDQIEGMLRMIHSDAEGPINLGNPTEFTIKNRADLVITMTKSKSTIRYVSPAPSDPKQRQPDITRATQLLGWEPQVQLEEGLRKTIAWLRSHELEQAGRELG